MSRRREPPPLSNAGPVPIAVNRYWYPQKKLPPDAIYCGRGTPLGNPFTVAEHGGEALEMYRRWLWQKIKARDPKVVGALDEIKPTSLLACSCKPRPCHVDVIISAWSWLRANPGILGA